MESFHKKPFNSCNYGKQMIKRIYNLVTWVNRQVAFCKIFKKLQDLLWYKRSVMESFIGCFLVDFAHSLLKQLFMNSRWWTFTLLFLSIWSQCSVPILHPPEKSENLNKKKWMNIFLKFFQVFARSIKLV